MLLMARITRKGTDKDELHCKIYFGEGHRTSRQSKTPKHLVVIFQWFETPCRNVLISLSLYAQYF